MHGTKAATLGAALITAAIYGAAWAQAPTAPAASQPLPEAAAPAAAPRKLALVTPMRDGAKLSADVYLPDGPGPFPVVLSRTPYLKDAAANAPIARKWTAAGYAFVLQDVRGKGKSEGFYDAFANDIEDGYDTVEGVAAQPWSNGKVGVTGGSALGITSNLAAVAQPPHLKAAFVIVAPNETFRTSFLGGVPQDADLVGWLKGQGVPEATIKRLQANEVRNVFADRSGGPGDAVRYISIPIWNVGGWYDIFNTGSVENFERLQHQGAKGARGNQRLTMGPFGHGALSGDLAYPGAMGLMAMMASTKGDDVRWFDYWLKGQENGVMSEPPVQAFMMASARKGAASDKNRWMRVADWPMAHRDLRFYLTPDLALAEKAPAAGQAKVTYRFDPAKPVPTVGGANLTFARGPMDQRAIKPRPDYFRFQTPVLDRDVAIAGPVSVELWGATDGPDTDFEAKLVDVYPDGYEALVLDAPIRARYRHGRLPDQVEMMTPGAPEKLVIDLWNTALTFEKGHRIALHVTSSNSPRFVVNPNDGSPPGGPSRPRVATNSVFMDKDHPSALVLPVIYPDAK